MTRRLWIALGLTLLMLLGPAASVLAQGSVTGRIEGVVKDSGGAPLPGVVVTVSSDALVKRKMTTVTDASGVYRFPALPPGKYAVESTLSGFQTVRREGVRLILSQAVAVDLVQDLAKVATGVTVTADAPIVSVVSNDVSTSFGQDYLDKQAVPRNYYQVITSAPGVNADPTSSSGSAILAYGATTENQNAFTLDGVNIADSGSGGHWLLPSIQWMEEIQITGLGANAEYGGYTGGIINGVTKSGGNEFKGALEAYYEPEALVANNSPAGTRETFKFEDYAFSLGGPVLRDRLWFFGSVEWWHQVSTPVGALDTSDRKIPRLLGKLTYQANEKNRVFAMAEYDGVTNERRGISTYVLPSGSQKQDGPGYNFALNWESLVSSSNFLNVKVTGYDGNDNYLAYGGTDVPGHNDYYNTELIWGNAPMTELNHRHLVTAEASWSLFIDGLFGKSDSHSIKYGGLYEEANSTDSWRRNGGFTSYEDSSYCDSMEAYFKDPSCAYSERSRGYGEYEVHAQNKGWSLYAQDSMRLYRLTLNYGVRYTGYRAGWQKGFGDSTVYSVDFVDPRIGLAWDVTGNARWALKAHWGRYHSSMYTYLYDREASGKGTIQDSDSYWDPDTQTFGPWEDSGAPVLATMGNVSHPYVDELLLTVEHQLGKDSSVGLDFIDRRFRNIMGLVNTNEDYTAVTGVSNPYTGGTLPIWNLNTPQTWVLTSDNPGYRTFDSFVLRYDKRYANGWQLRTSLVWTDLKGNVLKNNGYADELRDRNGLVNADGKMDLSYNEWEYKLSGSANLPFGFVASGQYTFLSGQYYTPYARVDYFLDENSSTGRYVNLTERGAEKLPSRNIVDLRLAWGTTLARTLRLEFSLECFNVLNTGKTLDLDTYYARYRSGRWQLQSNYGNPTAIERPRELRAGLRLNF